MNAKDTILEKFLELAKRKEVSDIKVSDIAKVCKISRQGYYYHFADINELIYYAIEMNKNQIMLKDFKSTEEGLELLFNYSLEHRKILINALNSSMSKKIRTLLQEGIVTLLTRINLHEKMFSEDEIDFTINYHSLAILYLIEECVENKRHFDSSLIQNIMKQFA